MQYYPMIEAAEHFSEGKRFSYNVIVNLRVTKDKQEEYINKKLKINSDIELSGDELLNQAINAAQVDIVSKHDEFKIYDEILVAGVTLAVAYDRDLK